ncbi:hypothetical protein SAMN05444336_106102 [Albimonas donghaensis]|uniref:Uncharacterized protein n=1 Tax=Albimonas donghaensis TaxID=356660 RepID=A0A1H3CH30_9RHOB|nr:hypothetical protein [Albimonas donghaensis]SDX53320.1 hypothetical protein SAMN05444336_106102 [Albimonas donghaensis]
MTPPLAARLRPLLRLDAAACLVMSLALLIAAEPLARLTGVPSALLTWAGAALPPCAALMLLAAGPLPRLAGLVVAGNAAWAIASLAVLALVPANGAGVALVLAQAAVVAALAWAEARALAARRADARA